MPGNIPMAPRGDLSLDYQNLEVGPVNTTISWLYFPLSRTPCMPTAFRLEVYKTQDFMIARQDNLLPFNSFSTTQNTITISSQHFIASNIFRLSGLNENSSCVTSSFYNLTNNGKSW